VKFWDASAIGPLLWNEAQTRAVRRVQEQDADLTVWWGTRVECAAAMSRIIRSGRLSEAAATEAQERLEGLLLAADYVDPSYELRERAVRLVAVHPLTAADALQLATALIWIEERPARAGFVCLDSHLRRAAGREGFDVLPADRYLA
jgi:predicted nucleic acid-binding protein